MVSTTTRAKLDRVPLAVAEAVHEVGPYRLTVVMILERTGLSRTAFYGRFENAEDAFAFSWKRAREDLLLAVGRPSGREAWREHVATVIDALLRRAAAEPYLASLYLLHSHAVGPDRGSFDEALVQALADVLRPGRGFGADPPPLTEELVAFAVLTLIADRLREGASHGLEDLGGELATLATLPYLPPPATAGAQTGMSP
jgi:AcrR family transcriptional regulator